MDILNEVDQLIKLLEIGYKDSALVALRAIRKALVEGQKPPTNSESTKCQSCGKVDPDNGDWCLCDACADTLLSN